MSNFLDSNLYKPAFQIPEKTVKDFNKQGLQPSWNGNGKIISRSIVGDEITFSTGKGIHFKKNGIKSNEYLSVMNKFRRGM